MVGGSSYTPQDREAPPWDSRGYDPKVLGVAEKAAPTTLTFELPASMSHYAHDIRRFVDAMLYKLERNAAKGKWDTYSVEEAFRLLELEVAELKAEIGGNAVKTLLESADVANFALMIANIATERGK